MSRSLPPTRTDRLLHRLRDHPVIAVVIVLALTMIGVAQTNDALNRLLSIVLPGKDTAATQTYNELKYDLQELDKHIEGLDLVKPDLLWPALSGAGEKAREVCEHEPRLIAMDDGLAVRTLLRVCPFADVVDTATAFFIAHPQRAERPDENIRNGLFRLRAQAEGVQVFLRDSARRLMQPD